MRGVTKVNFDCGQSHIISTHTPRERRDAAAAYRLFRLLIISTHTPRERRDGVRVEATGNPQIFQLTRLVRGVTKMWRWIAKWTRISTHTPRERRDSSRRYLWSVGLISTHTPRERRDFAIFCLPPYSPYISTHTPRERRDAELKLLSLNKLAFQLTRLVRGVTPTRALPNPARLHCNSPAS